jgi:lysozyme
VAGRFADHRLWVRNLFRQPRLPDGRDWHVWQYANRARLPGVQGFVDRNAFVGTEGEFARFLCTHRGGSGEIAHE